VGIVEALQNGWAADFPFYSYFGTRLEFLSAGLMRCLAPISRVS